MKSYLITAGVALATFAVITFVQRRVMPIPMVGVYLPR